MWPGGTVAEMARAGVLSERLSVAHGVWLAPEEADLLARHGVTVVHKTPASNLMLGSGRLSLPMMLARGVPLAPGRDSSNSGGRHDLFEIMRLALMLPRPDTPDPRAHGPRRAGSSRRRRAAGPARWAGRGDRPRRAGSARRSRRRSDPRTAALAGSPVTVPHLVQHGGAAAVAAVEMIDGVWVLRDGRILAFDEPAVLAEVAAIASAVRAAAGPGLVLAETAAPYFQACSRPGGSGRAGRVCGMISARRCRAADVAQSEVPMRSDRVILDHRFSHRRNRDASAHQRPRAGSRAPRSPRSGVFSRSTYDDLRTGLCLEPRGHRSLLIAVMTEPVTPGAHFGLFFIYPGGYYVSCGEGTIGAATVAIETGMVREQSVPRPP